MSYVKRITYEYNPSERINKVQCWVEVQDRTQHCIQCVGYGKGVKEAYEEARKEIAAVFSGFEWIDDFYI